MSTSDPESGLATKSSLYSSARSANANGNAKSTRFSVNNVESDSWNGHNGQNGHPGANGLHHRFRTEEEHFSAASEDEDDVRAAADCAEEAAKPLNHRPPLVHRGSESVDDSPHKTHHTYRTQYLKSLRHYLTREVLPTERNYRNLLSFGSPSSTATTRQRSGSGGLGRRFLRPTLEELLQHEDAERGSHNRRHVKATDRKDSRKQMLAPGHGHKAGKVIKFGWLEGVFMRCLLNIWGVMLFLRLTWVIGQCGIMEGLMVISLCNLVTIITGISMSAVATNGKIKGGGIYYMISRSLGPEFGGAIGIMFTIANSIAAATYVIGFCEALLDMVEEYHVGFEGIVATLGNRTNDLRLVGAISLVAILLLVMIGMDWVTRVQLALLGLLLASQVDFFVGTFLPGEEEKKFGFVGYSWDVLKSNFMTPSYHSNTQPSNPPSFFAVYGVFFPAVTGIVAGANLSGDLKDPATAIPKGTLLAIAITFFTYAFYGLLVGSVYLPQASGVQEEYDAYLAFLSGNDSDLFKDVPFYNNCTHRACEYGSANDYQTMSKISYTKFLVYAGCFAATLSSAIASVVGAPRVLQALARDKLYPLIGFFGKGFGANDDPFRGYVLVFFVALGFTMIGDLNFVGTLLSNFFVAAYALINFSVFHASITKSPGWRPSFKYYNAWVSLFGTVLCVSVMFLIDWETALATFATVCVLYFYISYKKPDANWGSSTQAQQFLFALNRMQALNEYEEHVKNYRPRILAFSGRPGDRQPLIDFANLITKKLSLLICADIKQSCSDDADSLRCSAYSWLSAHSIKAFYSVVQGYDFEKGADACMQIAGLGKMMPNMVLVGFKRDWRSDASGRDSYVSVLVRALEQHMAVAILRLEDGCDFSDVIKDEEINKEPSVAESDCDEENNDVPLSSVPNVVYRGHDGNALEGNVVESITKFKGKRLEGTIDVWWLYDDGGLTLLLPYILTTRAHFRNCKLRVFTLANKKDQLDSETRNMAALLAKFRIASDVTVLSGVTDPASEATRAEYEALTEAAASANANAASASAPTASSPTASLDDIEKTNRHLRLTEMLREHSTEAQLVIMTLPMPRRSGPSSLLYMSWLEMMTRKMPPFLLVRGNQSSVLTFYS